MSVGAWYPDPTGRHQVRYAEPGRWTDTVADAGVLTSDPIPGGSTLSGRGPRRRKWPWVVGVLAVVVVVLAGFGVELAMRHLDTYTADLTRGRGDFPAVNEAGYATSYQSDGYHLLIREPDTFVPAGLEAATAHTVLAVEIETAAVQVPSGAAFGPSCWQDETHGYGLLVDGSGSPQLVQISGSSAADVRVLATGTPTSAKPGRSHRLMVTCDITGLVPGTGGVHVKGYIDGAKVIDASAAAGVSEFRYTGFSGRTTVGVPAEWRVTKFWRKGPHDMPAG